MFRKTALSLGSTMLMGVLCACSPMESLSLSKGESNNKNTNQQAEKTSEKTPNSSKIGAPIAIPPSYATTPNSLNTANTPGGNKGFPALKPMKGVNIDTLFSQKIKDPDKRFNRVEDAVVDLRKEFDSYKPAIVRLSAVEADIQNLIQELEVLLQETPPATLYATPPTEKPSVEEDAELNVGQIERQPASAPTPLIGKTQNTVEAEQEEEPLQPAKKPERMVHKKPQETKSAPSTPHYDGKVEKNLRVGEHKDKVRLVLDSNQPLKYFADLDNDERLMIIELPSAKWVGKMSATLGSSNLIESYSIDPINGGKGSMIILSLKKGTSVINEGSLSPDKSSPYHRIYIDLKL